MLSQLWSKNLHYMGQIYLGQVKRFSFGAFVTNILSSERDHIYNSVDFDYENFFKDLHNTMIVILIRKLLKLKLEKIGIGCKIGEYTN